MNHDDVIKYKSLYLQTSWGYLNMLRKNIAFLQKGTKAQHSIDAAHLAAHSLKSQSNLMGYTQLGQLSEVMEKIFKANKDNVLILDSFTLEIIHDALKELQLSLSQIADNGQEIDLKGEIEKLNTIITE